MAEYFGQFTIDEMYVWRKAISENDIKIIFEAHSQSKCHANESRTIVTWAQRNEIHQLHQLFQKH